MDTKTCSIDGCYGKLSAKGYCYKHYRRMRRRGEFGFCPVPGCTKGKDRGGMCNAHYGRKHKGVPLDAPMNRRFNDDLRESYASGNMEEAFRKVKARCAIDDENGCWEYPRVNGKGYGELSVGAAPVLAHRLMARISLPEFEDQLQVHHKCANRVCCNPAHLQMLTSRENRAEMMERNYYLKRIATLEEALRGMDSGHPLLTT